MDILAARKKAAERAEAAKKSQAEAAVESNMMSAEGKPGDEQQPAVLSSTPLDAVQAAANDEMETAPAKAPLSADDAEGASAAIPEMPEIEMLSFRLGQEEYAVMVDDVKEVLQTRDLTPVPNAPDYVLGVTALRGPILPVIDLCRRLGLPQGIKDDKARIVVVTVDDEEAGIVVDRVTGVVRIPADAVRPAPETIEHGAEFLRGIARKGERLFILLDTKKAIGA